MQALQRFAALLRFGLVSLGAQARTVEIVWQGDGRFEHADTLVPGWMWTNKGPAADRPTVRLSRPN